MSDPMHPNDEAQRRDGLNREHFAIRRQLRELTDDERGLAQKLRAFAVSERKAKQTIESHSRAEHWGREPERPWAWRAAPDPGDDRIVPTAPADGARAPAENPGLLRGRLRRGWGRIAGR
jgi:hypothetical protein